METNENLKKVAFIFFFILGATHILSGLMMEKKYFVPYSSVFNDILTIPFAMSALIYAFTLIYGTLQESHRKIATNVFIGITLIVFVGMILINILL